MKRSEGASIGVGAKFSVHKLNFGRGPFAPIVLVVPFTLWWHAPAHAYCTLTACSEDAREGLTCRREDGCIVEGLPLYPKSPCFQYSIAASQAAFVGLSDEEFESVVRRAFARWQAVDCGNGRRPGFRAESAGVVQQEAAFACNRRRLNIDTWLLISEWQRAPSALGFTVSVHAVDDGEVFDADVEINVEKIARDVPPELWEAALLSVGTHEAGHVLGLHHSNDPTAVMAASYGNPGDIRDLTADDIQGICSLFPDAPESIVCGEPVVVDAALDQAACDRAGITTSAGGTCSTAHRDFRSSMSWRPGTLAFVLCCCCCFLRSRVGRKRPSS